MELDGILHFFCEAGFGGGYWAFQDRKFIEPNTSYLICNKCYLYWNRTKNSECPTANISNIRNIPLDKAVDLNFQLPPECETSQHNFRPIADECWSYDGLHILENGDILTVNSKDDPNTIIWKGTIKLSGLAPGCAHVNGVLKVFSFQEDTDKNTWLKWFFEEYPAKLIKIRPQR
ncbi:MAG: hypothetical protein A3B91_00105 [Candidatus Yanofskybacteria bacterium RIFCSPHIGHO2_02_FULL_41_29]|uniref:Uncharacterized protein n=1 Tax=Candidatus Yanofskybacteria bacterium RIFCSPHIGHO2_01_FULL_41_53 TaxID=1802663 RepID=A0A1F8EL01_9BACT|nr:MAG: hypothetical protein A2650_02765 [Candidatus Yanofskybacteria bacterium RIFCSPHIGHO2_01_FULL_41_53]OGN10428.1 MAG: hypothetical protein A3B91_00105 [Candidatus Yanofskybacteria bacterium RIFCSPHIGHO2_02_FULL_41_29]OGN21171.1 MAG: hypothetical protein A2916_02140 [Candidatus Yanofskybacteria bacterium RIFCSPLOWO2_01_FULL_41_67]OGN30057.1 MAG: hypothetical protein A3H54_02465 [Candidatus Yanofskybacteria bacterium RIFCSPLOWO2_02_FULL_41_13]OGN35692.1 MAG: hypothetical protein A3F98_03320 